MTTTLTIAAAESVPERIARLGVTDISDSRMQTLVLAHPLVDDALFARIGCALRVSRRETIILPAHRYEGLSRGSGWARQGRGDTAVWGERTDGGYRVGTGHWTVGGHDGFERKASHDWVVAHVRVGAATWTTAD